MGTKARPTASDLTEHLSKNAREYSFFQAVELLQHYSGHGDEVGTRLLPVDESVSFRVDNSLAFPTSDIKEIISDPANEEGHKQLIMTVTFLGLHGASSPLPTYYQEKSAHYQGEGSLLRDFFDYFHNRVVGLMHRVMRKYRYYIRYQPTAIDRYSKNVFSLFGLADDDVRNQTGINWARLLCFAGILSTRNRSPYTVSAVIRHAFQLDDVSVEEWVYRKVDIPYDQRWSLARQNSVLGENSVIGERVPDVCGKFRVHLKNLSAARFREFLPSGESYKPLCNLIEFMLRDQFSYDLNLGLASNQASPIVLDQRDNDRLGWASFLGEGLSGEQEVIIAGRL